MKKLVYISPLSLTLDIIITVLLVEEDHPIQDGFIDFSVGGLNMSCAVTAVQSGEAGDMENAIANHTGQPYFADLTTE